MIYRSIRNDLFAIIKTPYADPKHLEKAICSWVGRNVGGIIEALDIAIQAEKAQSETELSD